MKTITIRPEALVCDQRGGKHVYLVCGRIPGDDDDSAYLIQAEDKDQAWEIFEATLIDECGVSKEQVKQLTREYGGAIIGVSCLLVGDVTED